MSKKYDYKSMTIESNLGEVLQELGAKTRVITEALGLAGEGNAIKEITNMKAVDTGRLRNSLTFATAEGTGNPNGQSGAKAETSDYTPLATPEEGAVYIGTNVEYAPVIEYGSKKGHAPRPFLKTAIEAHTQEYKDIIEKGLK